MTRQASEVALPAKNTCDVYPFSLCSGSAPGEQPVSVGPTSHVRSFQRSSSLTPPSLGFLPSIMAFFCFPFFKEGKIYGKISCLCRAQFPPQSCMN